MEKREIVIGLPSPEFLSLEELDSICQTYGEKINYWYISPPFGMEYASRKSVLYDFSIENIILLKEQFKILKKYNQRIELALNGRSLLRKDFEEIKEAFDVFCKIFGKPDSLVLLKEFIPYFSQFNIPITYSYNNITIDEDVLHYCDTIVLGNRLMRDVELMKKLKNDYGLKIELLVNNGCHFLCNRSCGHDCETLQQKAIEEKGKYQCLAEQSFLPHELKLIDNYIDFIKISSRPATYKDIVTNIDLYSSRASFEELQEILPMDDIHSWRHFSKLTNIIVPFRKEKVDYKQILKLKDAIWKGILEKI